MIIPTRDASGQHGELSVDPTKPASRSSRKLYAALCQARTDCLAHMNPSPGCRGDSHYAAIRSIDSSKLSTRRVTSSGVESRRSSPVRQLARLA